MKNIKQFSAFILAVLTLCGCSDLRDGGSYSSKTKARISVSIAGIDKSSARNTALPPSVADLNKLSDFVLCGKYNGGQEQELASASTYTELSQKQIEVQAGYWSFTLNVKYNGIDFSGNIESQEIKLDSPNTLSFVLSSAATNGGFTITLGYIGNAALAVSTLYNWPDKTQVGESEETELSLEAESGTVKFEVPYEGDSSADSSGISSGSYRAEIVFYADADKKVRLSTYPAIVRIAGGLVSTLTDSMTLDEAYSIEYMCLCNDEAPQDLLDQGSGVTSSLTLPLVYSRKSEAFNLPPDLNLSGFHFAGWYADDDCTEAVTGIPSNSTGDKTFYAAFVNAVTVSSSAAAGSSGLRQPVASIAEAVECINGWNDESISYTVFIDGVVSGAQVIADTSNETPNGMETVKVKASSITIQGKSGNENDVLNAQSTEAPALYAGTFVPVTVKNLKITGGKSGIKSGTSGVDLTLEEGCLITENSGSGVTVEAGSVTMTGGTISGNNAENGSGVYISPGASFTMTDGIIKENTCASTGKGSGVYVAAQDGKHATFKMGANAVVAEDNDVYLSNGTFITVSSIFNGSITTAAVITPAAYSPETVVLAAENVDLEYEASSFKVTPFNKVLGDGTSETSYWRVTEEGKLQQCADVDGIIGQIEGLDDGVGEIAVRGYISTQDLESISSAISGLSGSARVQLYLTGAEGLTELPEGIFQNCECLKTIELPSGITSIPSNAFAGCANLSTIRLPSTIEAIDSTAFEGCISLVSVSIGEGSLITADDEKGMLYAAEGTKLILCYNTLSHTDGIFTVPEGVTTICTGAFYSCSALNTLVLPSTLETIESGAFDGCENIEIVYCSKAKDSIIINDTTIEAANWSSGVSLGINITLSESDTNDIVVTDMSTPESTTKMYTVLDFYATLNWKFDDKQVTDVGTDPDACAYISGDSQVLYVDTSRLTPGYHDISLIAVDDSGRYYSYYAQLHVEKQESSGNTHVTDTVGQISDNLVYNGNAENQDTRNSSGLLTLPSKDSITQLSGLGVDNSTCWKIQQAESDMWQEVNFDLTQFYAPGKSYAVSFKLKADPDAETTPYGSDTYKSTGMPFRVYYSVYSGAVKDWAVENGEEHYDYSEDDPNIVPPFDGGYCSVDDESQLVTGYQLNNPDSSYDNDLPGDDWVLFSFVIPASEISRIVNGTGLYAFNVAFYMGDEGEGGYSYLIDDIVIKDLNTEIEYTGRTWNDPFNP